MMERVKKIKWIEYRFERSKPPNLIVMVKGEVPTLGWNNIQLLRREYVGGPPESGLWEYDLIAEPPKGPAAEKVTEVEASNKRKSFTGPFLGVRVFGVDGGVLEARATSRVEIVADTNGEFPHGTAKC